VKKSVWAGVDIGGTKTAVTISLAPPVLLSRVEFPTLPAKGPEPTIRRIENAIHESLISNGVAGDSLAAIGVSCGGPLDRVAGVIQAGACHPDRCSQPRTDRYRRPGDAVGGRNSCSGKESRPARGTSASGRRLPDCASGVGRAYRGRGGALCRAGFIGPWGVCIAQKAAPAEQDVLFKSSRCSKRPTLAAKGAARMGHPDSTLSGRAPLVHWGLTYV